MNKYYNLDNLNIEIQEIKISFHNAGKIREYIKKIHNAILKIEDKETRVFLLICFYYQLSMKWYKKLLEGEKRNDLRKGDWRFTWRNG